jgi:hypothetical protein
MALDLRVLLPKMTNHCEEGKMNVHRKMGDVVIINAKNFDIFVRDRGIGRFEEIFKHAGHHEMAALCGGIWDSIWTQRARSRLTWEQRETKAKRMMRAAVLAYSQEYAKP